MKSLEKEEIVSKPLMSSSSTSRRKESLPHEVVEHIMERLPVKSLLRFKCVTKQWKSTIESRFFQERQLRHRQKSGDPDVLMATTDPKNVEFRTVVLGSSSSVTIPIPWKEPDYFVCQSSCDGIVCLYRLLGSCFLFNPTTRWHRNLPLAGIQQRYLKYDYHKDDIPHFVFGKDKFTGTYKFVWLYNSSEENTTTCEVFDFRTNAWRYVTPAFPYRIVGLSKPVYVDGLIHWFTNCKETKIVSLDLHTEAFQVTKAPFTNARIYEMIMCNLDNRLCVSVMNSSDEQVIWSFDSDNKTWNMMCSIDVEVICLRFGIPKPIFALLPLALLDAEEKKKKKKKLLFYDRQSKQTLMTYDFDTKSYDAVFSSKSLAFPICYFQSLFSAS